MEIKQIQMPIQNCFTFFDQSFKRIYYFLQIIDNLKTNQLLDEGIKISSGIVFSRDIVLDSDKKRYLIDGYKHFIRGYLLRDCIESFSLCLDELCFLMLLHKKTIKIPSGVDLSSGRSCETLLTEKEKEFLEKLD